LGEALDNPKALDAAVNDLAQITGQKPVVTKAESASQILSCVKVVKSARKLLYAVKKCGAF
jgi:hypothetical protein